MRFSNLRKNGKRKPTKLSVRFPGSAMAGSHVRDLLLRHGLLGLEIFIIL